MPKTVTRKRRGCDSNPGRTAPESSTLTSRLPSHPHESRRTQAVRTACVVRRRVGRSGSRCATVDGLLSESRLLSQPPSSLQVRRTPPPLSSCRRQSTRQVGDDHSRRRGAGDADRRRTGCRRSTASPTLQRSRAVSSLHVYSTCLASTGHGRSFVFTARCYASAVLAKGLCLSVRHKSEFYRNG